jgi:hypothetical protein
MPFGVKNGPHTYQWVIIKAFCEYVDVFMEIFLVDFTISSDLSTHIKKFKKFLTCVERLHSQDINTNKTIRNLSVQ